MEREGSWDGSDQAASKAQSSTRTERAHQAVDGRGACPTGDQRGSITRRMAVRSLPSISSEVNSGMQTISTPSSWRYPRAMAAAFTAWLTAPAPMRSEEHTSELQSQSN